MIEKAISAELMAEVMEIDRSTMYRRMKNTDSLTISNVRSMIDILGLTVEEVSKIFNLNFHKAKVTIESVHTYPGKFMGIADLSNLTGLSKDYFKQIAKAKDAPIVKTKGGGKIYFKTEELDAYMQKVTDARRKRR
jgi:predicted DNA-binding transcriptional regulator AlpA